MSNNNKVILRTNQLSKHYGRIKAVNKLDLEVHAGKILGILGPNGSGKTTTLAVILGLLKPTSGSYNWFVEDSVSNPNMRIGSILETPNFYPYLNAVDNLDIICHIKGVTNDCIPDLLRMTGLYNRRLSRFKTYSLGMKQRLAIAATLIGDPDVLIFDEPTNGLDPEGIAEVRSILIDITGQGRTVILASHILNEVQKICTHVAILRKGELLATGAVGSILNKNPLIEINSDNNEALAQIFQDKGISTDLQFGKNFMLFELADDMPAAELNRIAHEHNILISHLVKRESSLEE